MRTNLIIVLMLLSAPVWAVDSYRYLHVTIETPWSIFIFLIPFVLGPLVLMIILYWRHALKKRSHDEQEKGVSQASDNKTESNTPADS